jgi:hypothetical protein
MIVYDKLKNVEQFEDVFDFKCTRCNKNGLKTKCFTIKPINVSWKPSQTQDNSDLKNDFLRKGYDALLTYPQALIEAYTNAKDNKGLLFICECGNAFTVYEKMLMKDLKLWISKNVPFVMDLRILK